MPSRNTVYADLGWSYYPAKIDSRDGIDPSTGSPDATKFAVNEDMEINVNYEDRSADPTADDYYVLAEDVNVLQDAVIAIERVLGQMPYVPSDETGTGVTTISGRIARLEALDRFDARLGGAGWTPGTDPTILGHTHTGGLHDAPRINLATATTGELPRSRIQLGSSDADPLTSEYIQYTKLDTRSIKTVFGTKLDTTGGIITGALTVNGNVICRAFGEIDCINLTPSGTTSNLAANVVDNDAYCGQSKYFSSIAGITVAAAFSCSFPVRYNEYTIILRVKTNNNISTGALATVVAHSYGGTQLLNQIIRCNEFDNANQYKTFYFTVNHKKCDTNPGNKNLYVRINYNGNGAANMWLDSITVMPIHTAVWDE